jgi:class 3 adenylate cyclase
MGEETLPQLEMGIGVNAGEVVVGNIGSEIRAKYGIVGSAVNITQRIQSKAKGGEVVISESVYHHLSEEVAIKRSLSTSLKGIQGEIKLFVMNGN